MKKAEQKRALTIKLDESVYMLLRSEQTRRLEAGVKPIDTSIVALISEAIQKAYRPRRNK